MALNTTHGAYDGTCHRFHQWRIRLAQLAGMELETRTVLGREDQYIAFPAHKMEPEYRAQAIYGQWTQEPADILDVLFMHSDSEGIIRSDQSAQLADALQELLEAAPPDSEPEFRETTKTFIEGLRLAASLDEVLVFR